MGSSGSYRANVYLQIPSNKNKYLKILNILKKN